MGRSMKWIIQKKENPNDNLADFYKDYIKYINENPPEIVEKTMKFKTPEEMQQN